MIVKTAICPVCNIPTPVDDEALAAKRASCPRHGEFELVPANLSALDRARVPVGGGLQGTTPRPLLVLTLLLAMGMLVAARHSLRVAVVLLAALGVSGLLSLWTAQIRVANGKIFIRGRRTPLASVLRFEIEKSPRIFDEVGATQARQQVIARLRDGRYLVVADHLLPERADHLRRQLEAHL
jgi:hypothetical protein